MKLCWLYQKFFAHHFETESSTPAWLKNHLSGCEACRAFQAAQLRLTTRLTEHARVHGANPSPFLHGKILAALDRDTPAPANSFNALDALRRLAIPALGVFLVLAFWLRFPTTQPRDIASVNNASSSAQSQPAANANLSGGDGNFSEWLKELHQPLETELYLVASDAKTALASLTENFLPRLK